MQLSLLAYSSVVCSNLYTEFNHSKHVPFFAITMPSLSANMKQSYNLSHTFEYSVNDHITTQSRGHQIHSTHPASYMFLMLGVPTSFGA